MSESDYSLESVVQGLRSVLHQYLEAQYHIWDESLLSSRRRLFDAPGATYREPLIEATPFYKKGKPFDELAIPKIARDILTKCSHVPGTGVYPQPFSHQARVIEAFFGDESNIIVATGTGSGKTESFLLPLLASLAIEGETSAESAKMHGSRAILLYPMNALVNDQLGRLRRLFGDEGVASLLEKYRGRIARFGVYTGRTPYPGTRSARRNKERLDPLIDKLFTNVTQEAEELLKKEGKWPSKDMIAFRSNGYKTGSADRELYSRQEMQESCPDILVTNYSMLEYMLVRPIERQIFDQTREWLHSHPSNRLTIVIDEAHMYRGAAGAEVALLLRRLQSRLQVPRDKIRYILTSASLGSGKEAETAVKGFARDLTGLPEGVRPFHLVTGEPDFLPGGAPATNPEAKSLADLDVAAVQRAHVSPEQAEQAIQKFCKGAGVPWQTPNGNSLDQLRDQLFTSMAEFGPACLLATTVTGKPLAVDAIVALLFPGYSRGRKSLDGLLAMTTLARREKDKRVFLPSRLHLFYRGVSGIFACINSACTEGDRDKSHRFLGALYSEPRDWCKCGGRVFEVLTHRDCGAAYLRGFMRGADGDFLWHQRGGALQKGPPLIEAHFLLEPDRHHGDSGAYCWIQATTGRLVLQDPQANGFLQIVRPTSTISIKGRPTVSFDGECPVCLRGWTSGETKIMDLATKGDAPFAYLVAAQVKLQPPTKPRSGLFPNAGRKSLLFSDGRQKAARLARDIPREVERDVFRQVLLLAAAQLPKYSYEARLDSLHMYVSFIDVLARCHLRLFDGYDRTLLQKHVAEYKRQGYADLREAMEDRFSRAEIPPRYREGLLRQLGSHYYSLNALTLAIVRPGRKASRTIQEGLSFLTEEQAVEISTNWIQSLLDVMAFDDSFPEGLRIAAYGYPRRDWGILPGRPKRRLKVIESSFGRSTEIDQVLLRELCTSKNGVHYILPDKVVLEPVIGKSWHQCLRCTALSFHLLNGKCPRCGEAETRSLDPNTSDYLRARKTFWRDPVVSMMEGRDEPFNINVEEHTAQLSHRDFDDVSSTTEEFERRFKDILLDETDQPIDVLSSTTTMEVGIDIGSLVAVGLRNIPPMRQNYQQRAGRAGRRGSALSTVITFAQNSPHDNHYFTNPELIIAGDPPLPAIDVRNGRIVERHVHAAIIQDFFHSLTREMPPTSDLFTVLGKTSDFYSDGGDFTLGTLQRWLESNDGVALLARINAWIPRGIGMSAEVVAGSLVQKLEETRPLGSSQSTVIDELLEHLFSKGMLPTYAFPRDLCAIQIEEWGKSADGTRQVPRIVERPQQGMSVALSEYSPGRFVVVNKKTYRVGSVCADLPTANPSRAEPLFWRARKFVQCGNCDYVQGHSATFDKGAACPVCKSASLSAVDVIQPEVVFPHGRREVNELDDDQVFTEVTSAQLPVPEGEEDFSWTSFGKTGGIVYAENQPLVLLNKGEEQDGIFSGFAVCVKCGKAALPSAQQASAHERDYLVDPLPATERRCTGSFQNVYLGYTFLSDIFLLRVDVAAPVDTAIHDPFVRKPLEDALRSLAEGISLAAATALDIDPRELSSGFRFRRSSKKVAADIFLYDTSTGGAGYSNLAGRQFVSVFARAREILSSCDCSSSCHRCLRHYGNRLVHADLDRHLGLDAWRLVWEGTPPRMLGIAEQRDVLRPLVEMLSLEGWRDISKNGQPYRVKRGATEHVLGAYPTLVDPVAAGHSLYGKALLFSQYQLIRDLPGAFAMVTP